MELRRLTFTPGMLNALPPEERALVVVLGHALNEVNVLSKLMLISSNFESEPRVFAHASVCQAMVIGRSLAGKLHEAWVSISKGYFATRLGIKYSLHLEEEPKACLANLKAYFGRANSVDLIRNSFAFHYSLRHANIEIPDDVPAEELSVYFGPNNGSSLYQYAEYAMGLALISALEGPTPQEAFDRFTSETHQVVGWFNLLAQALLWEIFDEHTAMGSRSDELETIDIGAVPHASTLSMPFFIDSVPRAVEEQ